KVYPSDGVSGRRGISLIVDEIDDEQHGIEPLGQLRIRRHLVRDAGIADLALCPNDPLCQRRRRREKGARYLFRGQAADLTQRKGDPGFESDRRVTAGKDKPKAIILEGVYVPLVTPGALDRARHLLDRFVEARASAYSVDCLEAAGRYEPGTRIP